MGDGVLVIELELVGFADVTKKLQQLSQQMKQLGQGIGAPAAGIHQVGAASQRALGPLQRLINAQRQFYQSAAGTPAQQFDAQFRLLRAQQAFQRAQQAMNPSRAGGDFGKKLMQAITSSRIGFGANGVEIMPLVSRLLPMLAEMGPFGIALAAAVVALGALVATCVKVSEAMNQMASLQHSTGATFAETNKAAGVGAALGMSSGEVSALANQLAGRLATPEGMMAGASAGINDVMGNSAMFGKLDRMTQFLKAADAIVNNPSEAQATRLARALGMEKLLELRDMSPDVRNDALNAAKDMFGPEQRRAAADFRGRMGLLSMSLLKLGTALTPEITALSQYINQMAKQVEALNKVWPYVKGGLFWLVDAFEWVFKFVERLFGGGNSAGDKQKKATDANTRALYEMNGTLKQIHGGGQRARGAMPLMPLSGMLSPNQQAAARARRLGAFEL